MNINSNAITMAKTLLSITDTSEDDLLVILGTEAKNALASTHNNSVLFDDVLLARMIQFAFNNNNSESITSQTIAGVSESYQITYPTSITTALRGYNKIKVL